MKSIAICIPSRDEWKAGTAICVAEMVAYTLATVPDTGIGFFNHRAANVAEQRNEIVERAIANNVDYLMWVDSDMVCPRNALATLLSHSKDIVGASYALRTPPFSLLGHFTESSRHFTEGGLFAADYLPGGFVLVKADVYRKLGYPYYWWVNRRWRGADSTQRLINMLEDSAALPMPDEVKSRLHGNRALRLWLDNCSKHDTFPGNFLAEDYFFCRRAIRAGFKVWCDMDLTFKMGHLGEAVSVVPAKDHGKTVAELQGESTLSPSTLLDLAFS